jgi:transposase InsO family protein
LRYGIRASVDQKLFLSRLNCCGEKLYSTMAETNNLIERLTELINLQQNQITLMVQSHATPQTAAVSHEPALHANLIPIKLDGKNYPLWSQSIHMCLKAREKLRHILEQPPPRTDPAFNRWDVEDTVVKGWICNSLDKSLYGKFLRYPTAKEVWDAIATTFYDGSDSAQVYNLNKRVNQIKQAGRPVEVYYNELQDLWLEIDFRRPNPMLCAADIESFDKFVQESRVYTFLDGLDDKLDMERANILQMTPFPTLEQAFARVRKEVTRQGVMNTEVETEHLAPAAMYSKGYKGMDKSHLKCTHCGMTKHTKEQCFKLVGYPDWFKERRKEKNSGTRRGQAAVAKADGAQDCVQFPTSSRPESGTGAGLISSTGTGCYPAETENVNGAPSGTGSALHLGAGSWYKQPAESLYIGAHPGNPAASCSYTCNRCPSGFEHSKGTNHGQVAHQEGTGNEINKHDQRYKNEWILDTGATDHMTFDKNDILNFKKPRKNGIVNANGVCYPVTMAGDVKICPNLTLNNTLIVPSLSSKLVSVGQLTKELNCIVHIFPDYCIFQDIQTKKILGRGTRRGGLYYLDGVKTGEALLSKSMDGRETEILTWHKRLGHPSLRYMKKLLPQLFSNYDYDRIVCETCIKAKSHRSSYLPSTNKAFSPFELIHTDVWGPSPMCSKAGFRWYIIFVDDFSRMTWLYLLKTKDEVKEIFKVFINMVKTQFERNIKVIRSDNGTEFVNHDVRVILQNNGILQETSCVGTPQQNGVAERKNRHILEITRALLIENNVPNFFWDNAITYAIYLMNRTPTQVNNFKTPLQCFSAHLKLNSLLNLPPKIFGCTVYIHIQKQYRSKLEPRAEKCVFLGMGHNQKGYKCYSTNTRKFYTTMDVTFLENEPYFAISQNPIQGGINDELNFEFLDYNHSMHPGAYNSFNQNSLTFDPLHRSTSSDPHSFDLHHYSSSDPDPLHSPSYDPLHHSGPHQSSIRIQHSTQNNQHTNEDTADDEIIQSVDDPVPQAEPPCEVNLFEQQFTLPPRINRGKPPKRYVPEDGSSIEKYSIAKFTSTRHLKEPLKGFVNQISSVNIPTNVKEALTKPEWRAAMNIEMNALKKNSTWEITNLPEGKKVVGCKWVYTIKYNAQGKIERYKARLVAKGYTQTYGIDYQETFSPVAKLSSVRVLLSIAANLEWPLHQFDVKNAFLHGELEEEIYMEVPPGYQTLDTVGKVCKLKKALYGLKQSPRAWFGRFSQAMKRYGYNQSDSDHTMFYKKRFDKISILIIYVDDMIITGNDKEGIKDLEEKLFKEFEMKSLGGLKYFLGIEVTRNREGIYLSQRKYILDLLSETGMLDCKPVDTPMIPNVKLEAYADHTPTNIDRYQRLVGKLIYLAHTRPDIAYAVSVVSQFMHSPKEEHSEAVLRILRYLKGTPGKGIVFRKNSHLNVCAYSDADWAGCPIDRRSTTGYFTFVGGNLVTWKSKKQNVVSRSSAESEFRGMANATCELLWLRKLLTELGFEPKSEMQLFCDNKASIDMAHNPVQHDRTKHVEIDRHFIKEKLENKIISMPFVRSNEQLADILTKPVISKIFIETVNKLGMKDIYVPT